MKFNQSHYWNISSHNRRETEPLSKKNLVQSQGTSISAYETISCPAEPASQCAYTTLTMQTCLHSHENNHWICTHAVRWGPWQNDVSISISKTSSHDWNNTVKSNTKRIQLGKMLLKLLVTHWLFVSVIHKNRYFHNDWACSCTFYCWLQMNKSPTQHFFKFKFKFKIYYILWSNSTIILIASATKTNT